MDIQLHSNVKVNITIYTIAHGVVLGEVMEVITADKEMCISQAIAILQRVAEDTGVPRNIRRAASQAIEVLMRKTLTAGLRAANAISILEEVSQDPNMPLFARTSIWQAVTLLEQVRD
mgnify:CR=1 FL=1